MLCLFIEDHIWRTVGSSIWRKSASNLPYYEVENDHIVRKGSFLTGDPIRTYLMIKFQSLGLSKVFKMQWPPKMTFEHLRNSCVHFNQKNLS